MLALFAEKKPGVIGVTFKFISRPTYSLVMTQGQPVRFFIELLIVSLLLKLFNIA